MTTVSRSQPKGVLHVIQFSCHGAIIIYPPRCGSIVFFSQMSHTQYLKNQKQGKNLLLLKE